MDSFLRNGLITELSTSRGEILLVNRDRLMILGIVGTERVEQSYEFRRLELYGPCSFQCYSGIIVDHSSV